MSLFFNVSSNGAHHTFTAAQITLPPSPAMVFGTPWQEHTSHSTNPPDDTCHTNQYLHTIALYFAHKGACKLLVPAALSALGFVPAVGAGMYSIVLSYSTTLCALVNGV